MKIVKIVDELGETWQPACACCAEPHSWVPCCTSWLCSTLKFFFRTKIFAIFARSSLEKICHLKRGALLSVPAAAGKVLPKEDLSPLQLPLQPRSVAQVGASSPHCLPVNIRGACRNFFGFKLIVGILSQPGRPPLPEGWDSPKGKKLMFILHFRLF